MWLVVGQWVALLSRRTGCEGIVPVIYVVVSGEPRVRVGEALCLLATLR